MFRLSLLAGVTLLFAAPATRADPLRFMPPAAQVVLVSDSPRKFAEAVTGGDDRPRNPLGLQGHGADIAYLALFLCSPAARFVSGQVIAVDGAGSADQLRLQAGRI